MIVQMFWFCNVCKILMSSTLCKSQSSLWQPNPNFRGFKNFQVYHVTDRNRKGKIFRLIQCKWMGLCEENVQIVVCKFLRNWLYLLLKSSHKKLIFGLLFGVNCFCNIFNFYSLSSQPDSLAKIGVESYVPCSSHIKLKIPIRLFTIVNVP